MTASFVIKYTCKQTYSLSIIQGVSQLMDITAGGDFLGLYDQKSSYKRVRFWTVTELRLLET